MNSTDRGVNQNEITRAELSRRLQTTKSYVHALEKDGRIVFTEDRKRVLYAETLRRIITTSSPSDAGRSKVVSVARDELGKIEELKELHEDMEDSDSTGEPDYQKSRARKEHYRSLREKLLYEEERKQLLRADAVRVAVENANAVIRSAIESLPFVAAGQLINKSNELEVRKILIKCCDDILMNIHNEFAA